MWFLNKLTGVKWDIVDIKFIEELKKNDNYEIIEESFVIEEESKESETDLSQSSELESADNGNIKKIDYNTLSYQELQNLAKEKGLKSVGVSKENLIKSLSKVGE